MNAKILLVALFHVAEFKLLTSESHVKYTVYPYNMHNYVFFFLACLMIMEMTHQYYTGMLYSEQSVKLFCNAQKFAVHVHKNSAVCSLEHINVMSWKHGYSFIKLF